MHEFCFAPRSDSGYRGMSESCHNRLRAIAARQPNYSITSSAMASSRGSGFAPQSGPPVCALIVSARYMIRGRYAAC